MLFVDNPPKSKSSIKIYLSDSLFNTESCMEIYPFREAIDQTKPGYSYAAGFLGHLEQQNIRVVTNRKLADCIITHPKAKDISKITPTVLMEARDPPSIALPTRQVMNKHDNVRLWKWGIYEDYLAYDSTFYNWTFVKEAGGEPCYYSVDGKKADLPSFDESKLDLAYSLNWDNYHAYCGFEHHHKQYDIAFMGTLVSDGTGLEPFKTKNNLKIWSRLKCLEALEKLPPYVSKIIATDNLPMDYYTGILNRTKILVSPWGYNETCGKDVQGLTHDCIVIHPKTDMTIWPDVWSDHITCKPDFSDLEQIVTQVLDSWSSYEEQARKNGAKWREIGQMPVLAERIRMLLDKAIGNYQ